ncbi:MAG: YegS/Rv2252/BmrU family lipid kinase, partial [Anaerolineae bacterium]|nr:YegS/Rv2252/BmrU family lipid kinase [Anaerolineae bacterium]
RAREAIDMARQAALDGYATVVAAGGDGTYQEVINGVLAAAEQGAASTVGVIPVGSGCDFAYSVGVPSDLEGACARLARGQTKLVDLGRVTVDAPLAGAPPSRYFDNTVGMGFDGVVTEECQKFKRLRGMALYLPAVLKTVFVSLRPARAEITFRVNGSAPERIQSTVLMATVCNGPREGGGFFIAPEARSDDGLLDMCIADMVPRLRILSLIPHFIKGTHVDKPNVRMAQCTHVAIESPDPMIAHADGEMICTEAHRIECEILPAKVRVVC